MNTLEANEHLEMVDRILSHAVGTPRPSGALFIVWGVAGAIGTVLIQLVNAGRIAPSWMWLAGAVAVAAIAYTIFWVRRCRGRGRLSVVDAAFVRVLYVALLAAFVGSDGAFNIFTGWGAGAIWSVCLAIPLLFVGWLGNRSATIGGAILLASVVVANFTPHAVGYVLAAGWILGYAGAGLAFELQRG